MSARACSTCGAQRATSVVRDSEGRRAVLLCTADPSHGPDRLPAVVPCGGCGNADPANRCTGCMHDFGDESSAWVRAR